jgi:hypothetical protein
MLDRFSVEPCLHQLLLPGIVRPEKLLQERKNSGYAALNGDRNRSRKFLRQFFGTEKKKGAAFFREGGKRADLFFCAEKDPVRSGCGACLVKNRQLQCAGERQVFRCKNRKSAA